MGLFGLAGKQLAHKLCSVEIIVIQRSFVTHLLLSRPAAMKLFVHLLLTLLPLVKEAIGNNWISPEPRRTF